MKNSMLLLFIDSLPYEMVRQHNLFQWLPYKGPLRPGVGYSFTQKAEILKGLQPDQLGYLNYWYLTGAPVARLNPIYKTTTFIRDIFPFGDKVLHYLLARLWKGVANIPFEFVGRFQSGVPSSYEQDEHSILSRGKWEVIIGEDLSETNPDSIAIEILKEKLNSSNSADTSFFIALPFLDKIGHLYGPHHENYLKHAIFLDEQLKTLTDIFKRKYPDGAVCAFSDHGMINIKRGIHLPGKLFDVHKNKRAAYWLDSTMLRVWVDNEDEKNTILERLMQEPDLHILSDEERTEYGVTSEKFGSIMAITSPGVVFSPNHFGIRKPVGMHGFHPQLKEHMAFWGLLRPSSNNIHNEDMLKTIEYNRELVAQIA